MLQIRSTRKIESLCRNDIRFMWLSDESCPTHMTICNFINKYLLKNIEDISNDIVGYGRKLVLHLGIESLSN